jgi:hypothetical protein
MSKTKVWRLVALGVIVCGLAAIFFGVRNYYYPQAQYLIYKIGLGEKSILQDVSVDMSHGWFPIRHESDVRYPNLIFYNVQWNRIGFVQSISIAKHELPPAAKLETLDNLISYSKNYPWGRVYFVRTDSLKRVAPSFGNTPYKIVALVPSFNITIGAESLESLNEIRAIKLEVK